MGVIKTIKGAVGTVATITKMGASLWLALIDGDLSRKDIEKMVEFARYAMDTSNYSDIVKLGWMAAAVYAYAALIVWMEGGGLAALISKEVMDKLAGTIAVVNTVKDRLEKEEKRIRGILDNAAVERSVQTLRRLHEVALIVSPAYRQQIVEWNNSIRDLSREVFGEVSTLNSGLALVQMATYDVTAARGEGIDIAQNAYFEKAFAITEQVERRSRQFARDPGAFWFYLNNDVIDGLFTERVFLANRMERNLGSVTGFVSRVDARLTTIDDKFIAYRKELDPFLSDEKLIELDAIRRDFNRDIRTPLGKMTTFLEDEFPEIQEELLAIDLQVTANLSAIEQAAIMTTDPAEQTVDERAAQRDRGQSIFNNIFKLGSIQYPTLEDSLGRQTSIFKRLSGN